MQNSTGHETQHELAVPDEDRMAGIVAAPVANHVVEMPGKQVDDLAFAFIAPLRAENNQVAHLLE